MIAFSTPQTPGCDKFCIGKFEWSIGPREETWLSTWKVYAFMYAWDQSLVPGLYWLASNHRDMSLTQWCGAGENLPANFFKRAQSDLPKADLLIVMGTSLVVHPFASLISESRPISHYALGMYTEWWQSTADAAFNSVNIAWWLMLLQKLDLLSWSSLSCQDLHAQIS